MPWVLVSRPLLLLNNLPQQSNPPRMQGSPILLRQRPPKTASPISIQPGTPIRLSVNLVQVRVTVRDSKRQPVGNLHKEDFLLYDQGKLQPIFTFAVETRESCAESAKAAAKTQATDNLPVPATTSIALPDGFVALVFDDTHMTLQDASYLRIQASKIIDGIALTERMGVFSTFGQMTHDFTSDKDALEKTVLAGLIPRPRFVADPTACPE